MSTNTASPQSPPKGDWLSWLERLLDMQEVTGSNPVSPICHNWLLNRSLRYLPTVGSAAQKTVFRCNTAPEPEAALRDVTNARSCSTVSMRAAMPLQRLAAVSFLWGGRGERYAQVLTDHANGTPKTVAKRTTRACDVVTINELLVPFVTKELLQSSSGEVDSFKAASKVLWPIIGETGLRTSSGCCDIG